MGKCRLIYRSKGKDDLLSNESLGELVRLQYKSHSPTSNDG